MRDDTLVEPFAAQEIFVDGFSDHVITNGVMRCAGYRLQPACRENGSPLKVVIVRLIMPATNMDAAISDAKQAQSAPFHIATNRRSQRGH